jgi:hypothetical protein
MDRVEEAHEVVSAARASGSIFRNKNFQRLFIASVSTIVGLFVGAYIAHHRIYNSGYDEAERNYKGVLATKDERIMALVEDKARLERQLSSSVKGEDSKSIEEYNRAIADAMVKGKKEADEVLRRNIEEIIKEFDIYKSERNKEFQDLIKKSEDDAIRISKIQNEMNERERELRSNYEAQIERLQQENSRLLRDVSQRGEQNTERESIEPIHPDLPSSDCVSNGKLVTINLDRPMQTCVGQHLVTLSRLTGSAYISVDGQNRTNIRMGASAEFPQGCRVSLHAVRRINEVAEADITITCGP